jgi:D-sedoheptulose 7-phosphate isomerase
VREPGVDDAAALVNRAFEATIALHARVARDESTRVVEVAKVIAAALASGRQVLVFGNGGSAADAQHFAAEFVGRFLRERRAAPVLSLASDPSVLTCLGNDYGYDAVFARQIDAFGGPGDVAMGITTSGASRNVNAGLERARALGLTTVALTGRDGGETGRLADLHLHAPSDDRARVQEVQRTMLHVISELVERTL